MLQTVSSALKEAQLKGCWGLLLTLCENVGGNRWIVYDVKTGEFWYQWGDGGGRETFFCGPDIWRLTHLTTKSIWARLTGIEGDEFSSARSRLEEKTRTLAKKFKDCKGKEAELQLEYEELVREVTELKIQSCWQKTRFHRQKLMSAAVSLVETLKREAESRLPIERTRSVLDDLLCVKGLFSTILWMFCVRFLLPHAESTLLRLEAETSTQRAVLSEVWRFENECRTVAAEILTLWVNENKRLACLLLSRCVAFQRGVRFFFVSAAERLKDKTDLKRDTKMIATVDALTRFLRTAMVCREVVEGFNASEGLGGKGKAQVDFAPWFRALFWHFRDMEDQKKGGRLVVSLWGGAVRKIEAFGMMGAVRKAERDAFASADAAADARSLCESALYDPVYRNTHFMNTRLNLMWKMKAIEMSIRNRKLSRQMERGKERKKTLGVLREMEREWETAGQVECDETLGAEEENEDKQVQHLYLALLILYLEAPSPQKIPSLSLHSLNSERSYAQRCLWEWFACCPCERKTVEGDHKKDSRAPIRVGKRNSDSKAFFSSSADCHVSPPLLSDMCLSSLSDFLRDHILSFSHAGVALDYSYTSAERNQGDRAESSMICVPSSSSVYSLDCSSSSDSLVGSIICFFLFFLFSPLPSQYWCGFLSRPFLLQAGIVPQTRRCPSRSSSLSPSLSLSFCWIFCTEPAGRGGRFGVRV
uniref:Uncharacterized protein n=1 Tax=Chromera velia CCMP2878 TaxID=1169474 RepID=A0A0G4HNF1_9ALVE|eukprot:Cvel_29481.t1-p1 / transcript=Cvel_29481.t1 / gene=Cvel_29481 / organism=Chromera_velia_CCMP2878 / gene_product=hypothetical protein / transcript_product=hypothetical protein / location=Cvel_scaffold4045:2142-4400(+) / protein_length=703 / sequence_SO=supercontig / SO=protein_coding / is_pseudo=false